MDIHSRWIIPTLLTLKEKEILFLMCEAAGVAVHEPARTYTKVPGYAYLGYDKGGMVSEDVCYFSEAVLNNSRFTCVSYEDVKKQLEKMIRYASQEMDY